jgi:cytochrome c-type biogenesis protein CcmH/NrfF
MPQQPPIKPQTIALICVLAVALLFAGSIVISVAVVQAEHAQPEQSSDSQ